MSRVVFSTIGSLGDLHPLIAVGLELRRRGHAVSFCTSASYGPKLQALGFDFHPLAPDMAAVLVQMSSSKFRPTTRRTRRKAAPRTTQIFVLTR